MEKNDFFYLIYNNKRLKEMGKKLEYIDYVRIFLEARRAYRSAWRNLVREQNRRFKDIDDKFYSDKINK